MSEQAPSDDADRPAPRAPARRRATGLQYSPGDRAPQVVATGQGYVAEQIIGIICTTKRSGPERTGTSGFGKSCCVDNDWSLYAELLQAGKQFESRTLVVPPGHV